MGWLSILAETRVKLLEQRNEHLGIIDATKEELELGKEVESLYAEIHCTGIGFLAEPVEEGGLARVVRKSSGSGGCRRQSRMLS